MGAVRKSALIWYNEARIAKGQGKVERRLLSRFKSYPRLHHSRPRGSHLVISRFYISARFMPVVRTSSFRRFRFRTDPRVIVLGGKEVFAL